MNTTKPVPFGPINVLNKEYWITLEPSGSLCFCDSEGEEIENLEIRRVILLGAIKTGLSAEIVLEQINRDFGVDQHAN
jgi:hypothetical protein